MGCPIAAAKVRREEFRIYPKYRAMYVAAFDRMLAAREKAGKPNKTWINGEAVLRWTLEEDEQQILWQDIGLEI